MNKYKRIMLGKTSNLQKIIKYNSIHIKDKKGQIERRLYNLDTHACQLANWPYTQRVWRDQRG